MRRILKRFAKTNQARLPRSDGLDSRRNPNTTAGKPSFLASSRAATMLLACVKQEGGKLQRRYSIGAELIGDNQTHFRVWAPKPREVDVVLETASEAKPKLCPLTAEPSGYF